MAEVIQQCIFCQIANGNDDSTHLLYQDEAVAVFRDVKPVTEHHLLVTPRNHFASVNALTSEHLLLVQAMEKAGLAALQSELGSYVDDHSPITIGDVLLGYHRALFNTVKHLHLHVIHPATSMSFMSRLIFKPNTWWFQTASSLEAALSAGQRSPDIR